MLKELYIHNVATIEELRLEFGQGFQVLTGETGAGKSILVESIALILGAKASSELIRDGADQAVVEASFDIKQALEVQEVAKSLGLENTEDPHELLIKRLVSPAGKNKVYVNHQRATLKALQELSLGLIDFTGQHSQMSLLDSTQDIVTLDAFLGSSKPLADYKVAYQRAKELQAQYQHFMTLRDRKEERADWLDFQLKEFNKLQVFSDEEEAELKKARSQLKNQVSIRRFEDLATQGLTSGGSFNCLQVLQSLKTELDKNSSLLDVYGDKAQVLDDLAASIEDLSFEISKASSKARVGLDLDVEEIESRLHQVEKLKRRFGPELSDVLSKKREMEEERSALDNMDAELSRIGKEFEAATQVLAEKGRALSELRHGVKNAVEEQVQQELKSLLMPHVKFEVLIKTHSAADLKNFNHFHERGIDQVQFMLAPNPGLAPKPLAKIASGGEMSRIFLAIKQVLAPQKQIMTFIFDEIDTGISGAAVELVGQKLKSLSQRFQVFCITHHAQIASQADQHYCVRKQHQKKKTITRVSTLDQEQRVNEVARLMGGIQISQKNLDYAKELLNLK